MHTPKLNLPLPPPSSAPSLPVPGLLLQMSQLPWISSQLFLLWRLDVPPAASVSTGLTPSSSPVQQFPALPQPIKAKIEIRGGEHLEKLHPELAHRARLLYERAESEGIQLRFISGYRRFRAKKKIKKGGSVASWHHFGAAFDLNLGGRKSMKDALKNLNKTSET